jgi:hypothetical protein
MATLHEYFVKDGWNNFTFDKAWPVKNAEGAQLGEMTARLHIDFAANAKYVSFFIPEMPSLACPEAFALNGVEHILKWPETEFNCGIISGEEAQNVNELAFTGQIYLYSERPVPADLQAKLLAEASKGGHRLTFRSVDYANARNKTERPLAFISYDHRDRDIAERLDEALAKLMCPVWYDEYSLRVGDSLRESIEKGLRECQRCILMLTPNYLSNQGWVKREFDSIFTREIIEKRRFILPVWHGVSSEDLFQYSTILPDRVALQWSLGAQEVAKKLVREIYS